MHLLVDRRVKERTPKNSEGSSHECLLVSKSPILDILGTLLSRILQKPKVVKKKISLFFWNVRFITVFIKARHLRLSWNKSITSTPSRPVSLIFILILSHPCLSLPISVFFFGFPIGRSCDRPPRHRFFLVSLCLKANAEMVPKIPSCHYMLLVYPSRLKFISNQFHILCTCKITTATGWQPNCS